MRRHEHDPLYCRKCCGKTLSMQNSKNFDRLASLIEEISTSEGPVTSMGRESPWTS